MDLVRSNSLQRGRTFGSIGSVQSNFSLGGPVRFGQLLSWGFHRFGRGTV